MQRSIIERWMDFPIHDFIKGTGPMFAMRLLYYGQLSLVPCVNNWPLCTEVARKRPLKIRQWFGSWPTKWQAESRNKHSIDKFEELVKDLEVRKKKNAFLLNVSFCHVCQQIVLNISFFIRKEMPSWKLASPNYSSTFKRIYLYTYVSTWNTILEGVAYCKLGRTRFRAGMSNS